METASSPEKLRFKCRKTTLNRNYRLRKCPWSGILGEYTKHIKQDHPESYMLTKTNIPKFEWSIPFIGDQVDQGIIEFDKKIFVYGIFYEEKTENLYFSLVALWMHEAREIPYGFTLKNKQETKIFANLANVPLEELLKGVNERERNVVISRNILADFMDKSRVFEWTIEFY